MLFWCAARHSLGLTQPPTVCAMFCSVLLPTSIRRWPHHGRTFSIYLCLLSFCLTLPRGVLSTSRPCVAFLAFVHLALLLALSLSPGNSLVSSWCDHSMLASLLWQCLTVSFYSSFVKNPLICFFAVHETRRIFLSPFISKASRRVSLFFLSSVPLSQPCIATGHTSAFTGRSCAMRNEYWSRDSGSSVWLGKSSLVWRRHWPCVTHSTRRP